MKKRGSPYLLFITLKENLAFAIDVEQEKRPKLNDLHHLIA